MSTQVKPSPIVAALATVEAARDHLDNARLEAIEAVRSTGVPFYWDPTDAVFIGPDRHNDQWVITWDRAQGERAAGQMFVKGQRECNWQQCDCKRQRAYSRNQTRNF